MSTSQVLQDNLWKFGFSEAARNVLDHMTVHHDDQALVTMTQSSLAVKFNCSQSKISRAIAQLSKQNFAWKEKRGLYRLHPLLAAYESLAHMINHMHDPNTFVWPLNYPTGEIRPPRTSDARTDTGFDPDPDGGEDAPTPETRPTPPPGRLNGPAVPAHSPCLLPAAAACVSGKA
ncbi:hypothetical protein [Streptomyces sp. NPDC058254]|uniref:hypothetical protein n=1 Tax=Streptomyces sp. NPDC058254 TaxID=3346406 RepID=UPI0036EDE956